MTKLIQKVVIIAADAVVTVANVVPDDDTVNAYASSFLRHLT